MSARASSNPRTAASTRVAILAAAGDVLSREPDASVDELAEAAGVSRATFYRYFRSRADVLTALDIEPDPGTRERILAAAVELVGRDGLRAMSMDELAAAAGVSRASVYRLFPGKPALFDALLEAYSPFARVEAVLETLGDRPATELLPALTRAAAEVAAPRVGIIRSLLLEVTSGSPDALAGSDARIGHMIGALAAYLGREMEAGRLRPMHPVLAAQALVGPIILHLLTRPEAEHLGALAMPVDRAVDELTMATLHGLAVPAARSA
jgi:AcrR family transcriptional regulator